MTSHPGRLPSGKWTLRLERYGSWIGLFLGACAVIAMLLWASGALHRKVNSQSESAPAVLPREAELHRATWSTVPRFETAVGNVQAISEAAVASKILARVEEVNVSAGQRVAAGDVLIRLQSDDLRARLRQLESNQQAAAARQSQALSEYQRAATLLAQQAISQSEYQAREADSQTAYAELERARQAVTEANVSLAFATIEAPFEGVVVDKQVKPGDTAVPGQVLFRIYDPNHMQLVAQVRESLALSLKPGQQLTASLDALGYECQATISEVVPQANSSTHSFQVKVIGPCPDGIYSGMFGRLKLPMGTEQTILLPKRAIQQVGQLDMIQVVRDGKLHRRNIQVGKEVDDQIQVLSGIQPGEVVLLGAASEEAQR